MLRLKLTSSARFAARRWETRSVGVDRWRFHVSSFARSGTPARRHYEHAGFIVHSTYSVLNRDALRFKVFFFAKHDRDSLDGTAANRAWRGRKFESSQGRARRAPPRNCQRKFDSRFDGYPIVPDDSAFIRELSVHGSGKVSSGLGKCFMEDERCTFVFDSAVTFRSWPVWPFERGVASAVRIIFISIIFARRLHWVMGNVCCYNATML